MTLEPMTPAQRRYFALTIADDAITRADVAATSIAHKMRAPVWPDDPGHHSERLGRALAYYLDDAKHAMLTATAHEGTTEASAAYQADVVGKLDALINNARELINAAAQARDALADGLITGAYHDLDQPLPTLHARHCIIEAPNLDALYAYAVALGGPAWDDADPGDIHNHMIRIGWRAYKHLRAADSGHRLLDVLADWRTDVTDDADVQLAALADRRLRDGDAFALDEDDAKQVYTLLYRAADAADDARQLHHYWHAAATFLPDPYVNRLRAAIARDFETDFTRWSGGVVPIADEAGTYIDELGDDIDAWDDYPSNDTETTAYRALMVVVRHATTPAAITGAWEDIRTAFDDGKITLRQYQRSRRRLTAAADANDIAIGALNLYQFGDNPQ